MAKPLPTRTTFEIEGYTLHIIQLPDAAQSNISGAASLTIEGVSAQVEHGSAVANHYLILVSGPQGLVPYEVWAKLREEVIRRTGAAASEVSIQPTQH